MNLRISLLSLAFVSAGAFAQGTSVSSLDQQLTQEEGMTLISDGLYAQTIGTTESYVAVSPAGQRSLLTRLIEIRSHRATAAGKGDATAKAGHAVSSSLDELIAVLSAPQPKNQEVIGDCNGSNPNNIGPLDAKALAGGGIGGGAYGASGSAVNTNYTGYPVNTTNYVSASVEDRNGNVIHQQSTTAYGATAAIASAYSGGQGCTADSYASITCPGHASASIIASAFNHRTVAYPPYTCVPN